MGETIFDIWKMYPLPADVSVEAVDTDFGAQYLAEQGDNKYWFRRKDKKGNMNYNPANHHTRGWVLQKLREKGFTLTLPADGEAQLAASQALKPKETIERMQAELHARGFSTDGEVAKPPIRRLDYFCNGEITSRVVGADIATITEEKYNHVFVWFADGGVEEYFPSMRLRLWRQS
jgi:hypothetical protein